MQYNITRESMRETLSVCKVLQNTLYGSVSTLDLQIFRFMKPKGICGKRELFVKSFEMPYTVRSIRFSFYGA